MSLGSTSHVNLPILVVIQLFRSFSSCAYTKNDLFCWYKSATVEGQRVCIATDGSLFLFCLLYFRRLTTTFSLSVSLLWHVLDHFRHSFKVNILPTCDIFDHLKDRLVAQARPFPFPWQCWLHIEYEYWKRLAHWNRKGPACETKPTFYKQKQKLPSSNKYGLMVQRSLK